MMFIPGKSSGLSNGDAALAKLFTEAGLGDFTFSVSRSGNGDAAQPEAEAEAFEAHFAEQDVDPATLGNGEITGSMTALVHELLGLVFRA